MVLFLIGFMGAGKTPLGHQLAKELGYTFIDTDQVFELRFKQTIAEYFAEHRESSFRREERNILESVATVDNVVIATGGGLPCYKDTMEWMNQHGTTIYIKQEPEELYARLSEQTQHRPILKQKKGKALERHIRNLLNERKVYYEQAKFVFQGPVISPKTVINTIIF
ncbi:MAG: shikimate kinase [Bacteroidota bacterium]